MAEKIRLCGWTKQGEVTSDMPYKERAELLVKISKRLGKSGRESRDNDDKFKIGQEGLESLMGAGATILNLNIKDCGGKYISEVIYAGRRFLHTSGQPVTYQVQANHR